MVSTTDIRKITNIYYRESRDKLTITIKSESEQLLLILSKYLSDILHIDFKIPKNNTLQWTGKIAKLLAWYIFKDSSNKYYKKYILFDQQPESKVEELFIALGYQGQYFINRKNNGIVIHMNCKPKDSLIWSKRLQNIIKNSTPIPISKGQTKYYALYIPTTNMQDIEINIS